MDNRPEVLNRFRISPVLHVVIIVAVWGRWLDIGFIVASARYLLCFLCGCGSLDGMSVLFSSLHTSLSVSYLGVLFFSGACLCSTPSIRLSPLSAPSLCRTLHGGQGVSLISLFVPLVAVVEVLLFQSVRPFYTPAISNYASLFSSKRTRCAAWYCPPAF